MAVIVAALRAMQAAGTLKKANIKVVLTGDEEDAANPIDIAPPRPRRRGQAGRRRARFRGAGAGRRQGHGLDRAAQLRQLDVTVTGRAGPFQRDFSAGGGYGAIYELARIIDTFRRELPEDKLTFNVGLIGGGQTAELDAGRIRLEATGKTNIIAAIAVARGDLRALTQEQIERDRRRWRRSSPSRWPARTREISFDPDGYPPMAPTEATARCWPGSMRVNRDMGLAADGRARPGQARRRRHQLRRRGRRRAGRAGPGQRRRPCAGRDGRHPLDLASRPSAPRS